MCAQNQILYVNIKIHHTPPMVLTNRPKFIVQHTETESGAKCCPENNNIGTPPTYITFVTETELSGRVQAHRENHEGGGDRYQVMLTDLQQTIKCNSLSSSKGKTDGGAFNGKADAWLIRKGGGGIQLQLIIAHLQEAWRNCEARECIRGTQTEPQARGGRGRTRRALPTTAKENGGGAAGSSSVGRLAKDEGRGWERVFPRRPDTEGKGRTQASTGKALVRVFQRGGSLPHPPRGPCAEGMDGALARFPPPKLQPESLPLPHLITVPSQLPVAARRPPLQEPPTTPPVRNFPGASGDLASPPARLLSATEAPSHQLLGFGDGRKILANQEEPRWVSASRTRRWLPCNAGYERRQGGRWAEQ